MKPKTFMVIAGEASGDLLASELVCAIRKELARFEPTPTWDYQPLRASLAPRFFGAGGPHLKAAGVELAFDMTVHSVTGLSDVLKKYFTFRKLFNQLYDLALEREPDAILCVDFSGFNRRFAHAIRRHVNAQGGWFHDWRPKIIQYISPQVWASREERAYQMAEDYDLVLSIFPFEKSWYAKKVPRLHVEFVGNPMLERYLGPGGPLHQVAAKASNHGPSSQPQEQSTKDRFHSPSAPTILLLPGSRPGELTRHLPVMLPALDRIHDRYRALRARMVLPNERLAQLARELGELKDVELQVGNLPEALGQADLAIASTGTVLMECACFGVPTVALYKTSWINFQIGKRLAKVRYLGMPNILAGREIVPEFLQDAATPANLARAGLELLDDEGRRKRTKEALSEIVGALGDLGASRRAAREIVELVESVDADLNKNEKC